MAYLEDGYRTLFSFASAPGILLMEVSVTPFGMEGGDQIEVTTMRNNLLRTFAPQFLITMTEASFVAAYDPFAKDTLMTQVINTNDQITITYSDGSRWTFWGYLKSATPGEAVIGGRPTMNCTVVPTNRNSSGAETFPSYTAP
jgi:hypothetical protein